jgi:c-di-GMP-related signal transduction protein
MSTMRVIALTKNPATSVKELEAVISQDLALAVSILRQANSAYYGSARQISSGSYRQTWFSGDIRFGDICRSRSLTED